MTRWVVGAALALGCAVIVAPSWPAAIGALSVAVLAGWLHHEDLADARSQRADTKALADVAAVVAAAAKDRDALALLSDRVGRVELRIPTR